MTELSFSKSFLVVLDQRPQRLSPDHVEDPRKLPSRMPYTLPRTLPDKVKRKREVTSSTAAVNLTLKPLRPNPALAPLPLPSTPLSTTVATLKTKYAASINVPDYGKLKLLLKGKPLSDLKTLGELGFKADEDGTITVMLMGGLSPAAAAAPSSPPPVTAMEEAGMKDAKTRLLAGDTFWKDLKVFLEQRLRKEEVEEDPEKVFDAFRKAWKS